MLWLSQHHAGYVIQQTQFTKNCKRQGNKINSNTKPNLFGKFESKQKTNTRCSGICPHICGSMLEHFGTNGIMYLD